MLCECLNPFGSLLSFKVLSDPKKREIYDKYGEDGLKGQAGGFSGAEFSGFNPGDFSFSGFDPHETFRNFFGDEDPFKGDCLFIEMFMRMLQCVVFAHGIIFFWPQCLYPDSFQAFANEQFF